MSPNLRHPSKGPQTPLVHCLWNFSWCKLWLCVCKKLVFQHRPLVVKNQGNKIELVTRPGRRREWERVGVCPRICARLATPRSSCGGPEGKPRERPLLPIDPGRAFSERHQPYYFTNFPAINTGNIYRKFKGHSQEKSCLYVWFSLKSCSLGFSLLHSRAFLEIDCTLSI